MKVLNPDTLQQATGDELRERQHRTGEVGNGKVVLCQPDLNDPYVVQQVQRAACVATPYAACLSCRHHQFEYIFSVPERDDWVQCPRWKGESGTGPPSFYAPVWLSACRATPYTFCGGCPSRENLEELSTDKQKEGWLERFWKLTREEAADD